MAWEEPKEIFQDYENSFKLLEENITICYKIGLIYNLIKKLNNKDFYNCFDNVQILLSYHEYNNHLNNLVFFQLDRDLKFNIQKINGKKYVEALSNIVDTYLSTLESNLNKDNVLNNKSKYSILLNNFKMLISNFINNLVNKRIDDKSKLNVELISAKLLGIYNSILNVYKIILKDNNDEIEKEFAKYLSFLNEVLKTTLEERDVDERVANECEFYFEAINASLNIDADIGPLCFGGKNDEYKKIRECLLYKR